MSFISQVLLLQDHLREERKKNKSLVSMLQDKDNLIETLSDYIQLLENKLSRSETNAEISRNKCAEAEEEAKKWRNIAHDADAARQQACSERNHYKLLYESMESKYGGKL